MGSIVKDSVGSNTFGAFARMPHPPSRVVLSWANRKLTDAGVVRRITGLRSEADHDAGSKTLADVLRGRGGNDLLEGQLGTDELFGGRSRDYLEGGPGTDVLRGDGDRYDLHVPGWGHDTVVDTLIADINRGNWLCVPLLGNRGPHHRPRFRHGPGVESA